MEVRLPRRSRLAQGQGAADLKANAPAADPLLLTAIDFKDAWEQISRNMLQTLWEGGPLEGHFCGFGFGFAILPDLGIIWGSFWIILGSF